MPRCGAVLSYLKFDFDVLQVSNDHQIHTIIIERLFNHWEGFRRLEVSEIAD